MRGIRSEKVSLRSGDGTHSVRRWRLVAADLTALHYIKAEPHRAYFRRIYGRFGGHNPDVEQVSGRALHRCLKDGVNMRVFGYTTDRSRRSGVF